VGAEKIENGAITLTEVTPAAIELEAGATVATGIEPQAHHVFDPQRPCNLLVEAQPVKVSPRQEVRELAGTFPRSQGILGAVALERVPYLVAHRPAGLADEAESRVVRAFRNLVVGDDVARDEAAKREQDPLGKGERAVDGGRLAKHLKDAAVVGLGKPHDDPRI
jgi:hypothetical protein